MNNTKEMKDDNFKNCVGYIPINSNAVFYLNKKDEFRKKLLCLS
jgi:hypothetical protein